MLVPGMAMQDALTLAEALHEGADLPTALASYEAQRVPLCRATVESGRKFGVAFRREWARLVVSRVCESLVVRHNARDVNAWLGRTSF